MGEGAVIPSHIVPWVFLAAIVVLVIGWGAVYGLLSRLVERRMDNTLAHILNMLSEGVLVEDTAGRVLFINGPARRICAMFGLPTDVGAPSPIGRLVALGHPHSDDRFTQPDAEGRPCFRIVYPVGSEAALDGHSLSVSPMDAPAAALGSVAGGGPASSSGMTALPGPGTLNWDPVVEAASVPYPDPEPRHQYHLEQKVIPEGLSDNRIKAMWVLTDMTTVMRREDTLKLREAQFAAVLESSVDMIMRVEDSGVVTLINDHGAAQMGNDKANIIGRRLRDLLPAPEGGRLEQRIRRVCRSGMVDQYLEMRDGRWVEHRVAPLASGTIALPVSSTRAATVVSRDMTPERRLEQELRQRERFIRLIADNLPGLIVYADRSETLRFVNSQIIDWVGAVGANLIGRRIEDVLDPTIGRDFLRLRAAALNGRTVDYESSYVDRIGRTVQYRASLIPHRDDDGRILGFVGLFLDITKRHEAEEATRAALRHAEQANTAKTRFLAAASHDLRQPMQALHIYINLLKEHMGRSGDGAAEDLVRRTDLSLQALSELLDNLLDISKLEAGIVRPQVGPVSLQSLFERMEAEMRPQFERKGLRFSLSGARSGVISDGVLLERIIRNLLTNALRYTDDGGVILSARDRGETVLLQVWDTGVGIPADRLELIFEEFYQIGNVARDRRQGLGVGLAVVRRLASLLDHPLSLRSEEGRGTVFGIQVPKDPNTRLEALPPTAVGSDPTVPVVTDAGRMLNICVIDDDPDVLDGLALLLESWGHTVVACADLNDALEFLQDEDVPPAVILADFRLTGGATGPAAIETLRLAFGAQIPGIVLTGDTSPERLREVSAGGYRLLHKPVQPGELRDALAESV